MTDITLTQEQLNAILAAFGCTPPTNETPQKELRFTVNLSAALRIGMYGSEAPTASFSYVVNGQDVSFTYTGTGAETVVWNFGDGSNGTVQFNPTHTYVGSGPFTVTLTACNPMGCTTTSQVINLAPPLSAFHQAVVAAGFSNFYDLTLGDASNYGAAGASQNGIVTGGTFSAGGWTGNGTSNFLTFPTQSFTSGTFCILATAVGTPTISDVFGLASTVSGFPPIGVVFGELGAFLENFSPSMSAIAGVAPAPISVEKILLVGRYNHTSGVPELRCAISSTLVSPTLTTFIQQAGGEIYGDHGFLYQGSIGATGTLTEAIFYHTDYLSDAALQPILDAIVWS